MSTIILLTAGVTSIFSDRAMNSRRSLVDSVAKGLNRNLEQRDARGSIILDCVG